MGGALSRMRKTVALAAIIVIGLFGSAFIAYAATPPAGAIYGGQHFSASANGFCGAVSGHTHWRFGARFLPNGELRGSAVVQFGPHKATFSGKELQQLVATNSTVLVSISGKLHGAKNKDRSSYRADFVATAGSPASVDIVVHDGTNIVFQQTCFAGRPGLVVTGLAANASISGW